MLAGDAVPCPASTSTESDGPHRGEGWLRGNAPAMRQQPARPGLAHLQHDHPGLAGSVLLRRSATAFGCTDPPWLPQAPRTKQRTSATSVSDSCAR